MQQQWHWLHPSNQLQNAKNGNKNPPKTNVRWMKKNAPIELEELMYESRGQSRLEAHAAEKGNYTTLPHTTSRCGGHPTLASASKTSVKRSLKLFTILTPANHLFTLRQPQPLKPLVLGFRPVGRLLIQSSNQ
jgi:hypothetical protein